jgi:hypothetical protein
VQGDAVPVTMWVDDDHVVVRLSDDETHWAWERLTYSNEGFKPLDPGGVAIANAPEPTIPPAPTTVPAG